MATRRPTEELQQLIYYLQDPTAIMVLEYLISRYEVNPKREFFETLDQAFQNAGL